MKRLLLDTNIYGELILDDNFSMLMGAISGRFVVHGFKIVRDELRAVPRRMVLNGKNFRISLLHIYDELAHKSYPLNAEIEELAGAYYITYRTLGGIKPHKEIINDFLIVSCAAVHQIDVVVSEDNKSMLSQQALNAYAVVNALEKKRTPEFIGYRTLTRWLS